MNRHSFTGPSKLAEKVVDEIKTNSLRFLRGRFSWYNSDPSTHYFASLDGEHFYEINQRPTKRQLLEIHALVNKCMYPKSGTKPMSIDYTFLKSIGAKEYDV